MCRNKRQKTRLVGYLCPSPEKQISFCLPHHIPFSILLQLTKHTLTAHACFCKLHKHLSLVWNDSFYSSYYSYCYYYSCLCVTSLICLKRSCFPWHLCHFLLNILAPASWGISRKMEKLFNHSTLCKNSNTNHYPLTGNQVFLLHLKAPSHATNSAHSNSSHVLHVRAVLTKLLICGANVYEKAKTVNTHSCIYFKKGL